jgi:hypothetical protein
MIFAGLAIAFLPLQAWAVEEPNSDADGDGILFMYENNSIYVGGNNSISYSTVSSTADLCIMIVHPPVSLLPTDPFELMPNSYSVDGVIKFMETHVAYLTVEPASQKLINSSGASIGQNALLLFEDQSTSDGDLGTSQISYPAFGDGISGRVYTKRIGDDVKNACNLQDPSLCSAVDSSGNLIVGIDAITNFYTKNVVAHETFHMLGRVIPADSKLDNHYPQLGYVMDHHMYYKEYKKDKKVVWFITDKWASMDIPRFK